MQETLRRAFPYLTLALLGSALLWAVSFGTLPRADFSFANGDEVRTVDPAKASGQPEHRVLNALFEGLLRQMPSDEPADASGNRPLRTEPGVAAEMPQVSEDGKVYTFRLRPDARWSNGDRMTSEDFVFSWRRALHPDTASEYAYQLYYLQGAEKYNTMTIEVGEPVEVELSDRPDPLQPFPRGTMLKGTLRGIARPAKPVPPAAASKEDRDRQLAQWKRRWTFLVDIAPGDTAGSQTDSQPKLRAFSREPSAEPLAHENGEPGFTGTVEKCEHVLLDFDSQVGVQAPNPATLVVTLKNRTPYFPELAAWYTLFPVHRGCVERHGSPYWTKPENIVSNGPYSMQMRRIRDRIRMVKNPYYWDAANVSLNVIDVMAVKFETTQLSMFMTGQLDWCTTVPRTMVPELKKRPEWSSGPLLSVYFYRLNVGRKPLDDVRIRRALNLAIDKQQLCERVTKAGEIPARSFVPPGLPGYQSAYCGAFDVATARKLLAEAGFPGGKNLPKLEILYNTVEAHRSIAEVIQQNWKSNLGIDVELRNLEWGVYLDSVTKKDYTVARGGWIGDYPDPNTFLDMFVTDGAQNNTNWSHPEYDRLITAAASEGDSVKRLELLRQAEQILMDELPIVPLYFYVSLNMVHPRIEGFSPNIQDIHPLNALRLRGDRTVVGTSNTEGAE